MAKTGRLIQPAANAPNQAAEAANEAPKIGGFGEKMWIHRLFEISSFAKSTGTGTTSSSAPYSTASATEAVTRNDNMGLVGRLRGVASY
jgi:hypothetical protein